MKDDSCPAVTDDDLLTVSRAIRESLDYGSLPTPTRVRLLDADAAVKRMLARSAQAAADPAPEELLADGHDAETDPAREWEDARDHDDYGDDEDGPAEPEAGS